MNSKNFNTKTMKNKNFFYKINIDLKTSLNNKTLKFNLLNIFRKEQFKNVQYVSMQIKVGFFPNGGKTLGNKFILDLKIVMM